MRSEQDILDLISDLEKHSKSVKEKQHTGYWLDEKIPVALIKENNHKISALGWVLGKRNRFD